MADTVCSWCLVEKKHRASRTPVRYASAVNNARQFQDLVLINFATTGGSFAGWLTEVWSSFPFVAAGMHSDREVAGQVICQFHRALVDQTAV